MVELESSDAEFGGYKAYEADLMDRDNETSIAFRPGLLRGFPIALKPRSQIKVGLKITAPPEAKPGDVIRIDLVQRNRKGEVVGGITVQVNIVEKSSENKKS